MRKLTTLAAIAFLAAFAVSCGGDDDSSGPPPNDGGTNDSPPRDMAPPDMGGTPDAFMGPKALGQTCTMATPCPTGFVCINVDLNVMDTATGFCTVTCGGQTDMTTCPAAHDMAMGGVAGCVLVDQMMQAYCGVLCQDGTTPPSPPDCPFDLVCVDANMSPATLELCSD